MDEQFCGDPLEFSSDLADAAVESAWEEEDSDALEDSVREEEEDSDLLDHVNAIGHDSSSEPCSSWYPRS